MTATAEMLQADQEMSVVPHNPCESCQECCRVMGVLSLGKPYNCQCEHQCSDGCAIYDERPVDCRTFACFYWIKFLDGENMRPDKLGVMLTLQFSDGAVWLDVHECREGALDGQEQEDAVNRAIAVVNSFDKNDNIAGIRVFPYGSRIGITYPHNDAVYPNEEDDKGTMPFRKVNGVLYFAGGRRKQMVPLKVIQESAMLQATRS